MKKKKLKLLEVLNCFEAIGLLISKGVDLDANLGFDIAATKMNMSPHVQNYEEQRGKLIKKLGKDDGKGNFQINPQDESFIKFQDEHNKLLQKEINVEVAQLSKSAFNGTKLPLKFYEMSQALIK